MLDEYFYHNYCFFFLFHFILFLFLFFVLESDKGITVFSIYTNADLCILITMSISLFIYLFIYKVLSSVELFCGAPSHIKKKNDDNIINEYTYDDNPNSMCGGR